MAVQAAATPGEGPSMGPANSLAEKFAATAGMRHRRQLHADMPPMHATPTLTWCCCGKARATKKWQLMVHAQEQGRAERAAQVNIDLHAMIITVCMQHSGVQDGNVALMCCLLTEQHAHKDQPVRRVRGTLACNKWSAECCSNLLQQSWLQQNPSHGSEPQMPR